MASVQRPISPPSSFMALCLGLSLWLAVQGWVLPRLGLQLPTSLPADPPPRNAPNPLHAQGSAQNSAFAPAGPRAGRSPTSPSPPRPDRSPWLAAGAWPLGLPAPQGLGWSLKPTRSTATALAPFAQSPPGRVVIDLSDRRLYFYADATDREAIAEYEVAIGQDGWETPPGQYRIDDLQQNPTWQHPLTHTIVPPGPDNPLGAAWIGFKFTPDYALGIHGTLDESLVGQAVSHGCIRMRNRDIIDLYARLQLGWPLEVRP